MWGDKCSTASQREGGPRLLVGWAFDSCSYVGGAERTQAEFRAAVPEGIEVVDCPAGGVVKGLDAYCLHNLVTYSADELRFDAPTYWYHHDVAPYIARDTWQALENVTHICVSPLQRDYMKLEATLIPPAVPLDPFREASENAPERSGAVAVARNWWLDKGPIEAAKWAEGNGGIDFYGEGRDGSELVDYDDLPKILARYKTFVHLPRVIDPCPRTPIEAHAAGCELVVNRNVGSMYWIQEEPDKLETAAEDFWEFVLR